MANNTRPN